MRSIQSRQDRQASKAAAIALTVLLAGGAGGARAAVATPPSRAAVVQALSDCRRLTDPAARLACYDKAADAFDQAQAQGQVMVVDREQVRTVRRQSFGFNIPSMAIFTHGPKEPSIDRVSVDLAGARQDAAGRWTMTTTDGAVWVQTADATFGDDPHRGSRLDIQRGLLGSYFCKVDREQAVRCERAR